MRAQFHSFAMLCTSLLVSACTFIADLDLKQCAKDGDCAKYGVRYATYACEREVCVPFECETDQQCQARGSEYASYLCTDEGSCAPPACTSDAQCQANVSPTASCSRGRCVDEKWGCLYDDPPMATKTTLKFRAAVQDFVTRRPPATLQAVVCRRADPSNCAEPSFGPFTPGQDGFIDFDIPNVPASGFDGFVRFTSDTNIPLDFQFARPLTRDFALDDTAPLIMLREGTISSFGALVMMDFDEENTALMTMRVFDCQGTPAANVRIASDPAGQSIFFKADSTFLANIDAEATDENGIGGLARLSPGLPTIRATDVASGADLFEYPVVVYPQTLILTFAYAQDL